jgi:long-chain fatty acid transport protein
MTFKLKYFGLLLIVFLLCTPKISFSGASIHGARSGAMGFAFTGVADDPTTMAYNPAGLISYSGSRIYTGASVIIPESEYKNGSGQSEKTKSQLFFPPHFYASSDISPEKFAMGIGLFSPFGIGGRKWSENGLTRYYSTENTIATYCINPSVAYKILPNVSIGAGIDYFYAKSLAKKNVDQSAMGASDAHMEMDSDGDGWGYNIGLLFTPSKIIHVGAGYRSRVKVKQNGTLKLKGIAVPLQPAFGGAQFETDAETTTTFPDLIDIGIAIYPIKGLTIAVDYEWGGWSTFDDFDLDLQTQVPPLLTDSSTPLQWKDASSIRSGFEYWANESIAIRGGYSYIGTYVPDHTLGPDNPDADQHNITIGLGYKKVKWALDICYHIQMLRSRTVTDVQLPGTYETTNHAFVTSFGVNL